MNSTELNRKSIYAIKLITSNTIEDCSKRTKGDNVSTIVITKGKYKGMRAQFIKHTEKYGYHQYLLSNTSKCAYYWSICSRWYRPFEITPSTPDSTILDWQTSWLRLCWMYISWFILWQSCHSLILQILYAQSIYSLFANMTIDHGWRGATELYWYW